MHLVILHHHFRPSGVRRVIELATPYLAAHWPGRLEAVVLATGEAPDLVWLDSFRLRLPDVPVTLCVEPAFGYASELQLDPLTLRRRLAGSLRSLQREIRGRECLLWAHNPGLGRNLPLTRTLVHACQAGGFTLLAHHHDWWFENRWHHFLQMRQQGVRTLPAVAGRILAVAPRLRHAAINRTDARVLQRHFPGQAAWLPNPAEPGDPPAAGRVRAARLWLRRQLGSAAPVWLLPCRLLRRKNIAEALLLTRWLRPEAWLVTTGGPSSAEERPYARALTRAAQQHGWRCRLGVLDGDEHTKPSVPELLAASEAVLFTSLQEGFGLPFLEAVAARRPLVARSLPNIAPDLKQFGFRFPQSYSELWVAPGLFDWPAEHARQQQQFADWRRGIPRAARQWVGVPVMLAASDQPRPVPFSRLTLTAQLEVLACPPADSWARCIRLNPWLLRWREQAASRRLQTRPWPRAASRWLSGRAYARRLIALVRRQLTRPAQRAASQAAQAEFLRLKLRSEYLYPLLWNSLP